MALLLKNNAVFIHVPKTGGSWVVRILEQFDLIKMHIGPEHADFERVFNCSGHYLGEYIKKSLQIKCSLDKYLMGCRAFAIIREPVSYYESWWRFMEDVKWKKFSKEKNCSRLHLKRDLWHPFKHIESWGMPSFNEFIEKILKECPGFLSIMYEKYIPFDSNITVGKQETLAIDVKRILFGFYGISFDIEGKFANRINESKTPKPIWDKKLKEEIVKSEYAVYKRFGYVPFL